MALKEMSVLTLISGKGLKEREIGNRFKVVYLLIYKEVPSSARSLVSRV